MAVNKNAVLQLLAGIWKKCYALKLELSLLFSMNYCLGF